MWSRRLLAVLSVLTTALPESLLVRAFFPPLHYLRDANDIASSSSAGAGADGQVKAGVIPLSLSSDRQSYYATVQAGVITYRVSLDTASSDLWLVSSDCETDTCKGTPRLPLDYPSATFQTYNSNSTSFKAGYADGTSASGFVAIESLNVANMTISNQTFGVVTASDVQLTDDMSGVFGLGFPRLSSISASTNHTPYFVELSRRGALEYPLFGLHLTWNDTGSLSIGAIDGSIVNNASQIGWNEVAEFSPFTNESTSASYLEWAIPMKRLYANNVEIELLPTYPSANDNQSLALLDVGTSGIYGPYQDVERIFSTIDGARLVDDQNGYWAVPCDTLNPLIFAIGNMNFTLLPTDYLIGPAEGNPNMCLSWPAATQPSPDGIDWQLGAPFMRTVYSIFSFGVNGKEPPMIGLYPLQTTEELSADSIAAFFSSISAVIPTTLPNVLISTPSPTTPAYTFNTSVPATIGGIVKSGLATKSYQPFVEDGLATSVPLVTPEPSIVTTTDDQGATTTSLFTETPPVLGVPPGWNAAASIPLEMRPLLVIILGITVVLW